MHVAAHIQGLGGILRNSPSISTCHTFRATGIMAYLQSGGTAENAQAMAPHESPRATRLCDRTGDEITLDELEQFAI
jgi:integrase/recombinase XerD